MTDLCARCQEPIRLTVYGWGHVRNPGPRHHYARPGHGGAPAGGVTTAGAQGVRQRALPDAGTIVESPRVPRNLARRR